jgi:sec-independent protein translocase protein TatB
MFDIGWSELLLIAIIAIIVIGPKELPGVLRNLGRMMTKLRRTADDFRRQFEESADEAGIGDLRREMTTLRSLNPAEQIRDGIDDVMREVNAPPGAKPVPAEGPHEAPPPLPDTVAQAEDLPGASLPSGPRAETAPAPRSNGVHPAS